MYRKVVTGLTEREIDGEIVVLNPETGDVHQFNKVASCIWRALDQYPEVGQLVRNVLDKFDVDERTAKQDVQRFLEEMVSRRLVEAIEG